MDNLTKINIKTSTSNFKISFDEKIGDVIDKIKVNSDNLEPNQTYLLNINEKETHITPLIKEDLLEKDIFNSTAHPYFSSIQKKPITIKEEIDILNLDDVIVFSPHPDDEILGTCSVLHKAFKANKNIKVIYMTSGKSAGDPMLRQREALKSIEILGGNENNIFFTDMPFYLTKERIIKDEDYEHVRHLLRTNNPKNVFVCSDMFDPHATHRKCFDCLFKVLSEDKEFESINVFFYYSVWYWPEDDEYSHIVPYDYEIYKLKVKAMLEHESQMLTNFMGNDPRPFYIRATSRDSKIGLKNGCKFCEIFFKYR